MKIGKFGIVAVIIAFSFLPHIVFAQEFTLKEAISYALKNSPLIQEIEENLVSARSKYKEELSTLRTSVDLSASTAAEAERESLTSSIKLNLKKPLSFSPHSLRSVKIAELEMESARARYKAQMADALLEIKNAYYSLFKAQEFSQLADAKLKEGKEKVEIEQKKVERGVASEIDLLRAKIELGNLEKAVIEAENQLALAKIKLNQILGREPKAKIFVKEELNASLPFAMDRNSLIAEILTKRPEVIEAQNSLAGTSLALEELISQKSPSFSVYGAYQVENGEARLSLDDRLNAAGEISYSPNTVSTLENSKDGWRVGVTLTWTVSDGGGLDERIKQKQSSVRQAEIALQRTKDSIIIEVESVRMAVEENEKLLEIAKKQLDGAQKVYNISEERFQAGVITAFELLQRGGEALEAEKNYLSALVEYSLSVERLKKCLVIE
ncbi:TolC family protein [Candidatus Aerophobetes bacterium]|nr:TolC family protein [Candidatus Aerophobetes bacterium]